MIKLRRSWTLVLCAVALLVAWGVEANADDKTFVLIGGMPGESTDTAHAAWIDAYGLDSSLTNGGGATAFNEVSILKGTDKATPGLHDAIARVLTLPLVTIEVCRNTAPQQCYYKVELTNVRVSNLQLSGSSCVGSGACTPTQTESVGFKYTRIKWTYTPWSGGSPGTPVVKCYDIPTGSPC